MTPGEERGGSSGEAVWATVASPAPGRTVTRAVREGAASSCTPHGSPGAPDGPAGSGGSVLQGRPLREEGAQRLRRACRYVVPRWRGCSWHLHSRSQRHRQGPCHLHRRLCGVAEWGCGPGAPRPLSPPSKGTFWPTAQWGLKAELELGTGVPPHPPTAPMSPSPEATRTGFGKSKIQTIISHTNCGRCSSHSPLDRHSLSSPTARSQDLPESPGPSSCSHLLPGPSLCARGSERA